MFLTWSVAHYLLDRCCEICIVQTVNFPQEPLFAHTRTPFSVRVNAIKSNLMHANAHTHTHKQSQAEKLLNVTPQLPPKKKPTLGLKQKPKNAAGNGVDSSGPWDLAHAGRARDGRQRAKETKRKRQRKCRLRWVD